MIRIGMMIRSAKMNDTTPPKLIPPFHSTAARGALPMEQTKVTTATSGADQRTPQLRGERVVGEEQVLPERLGDPGACGAGDEQADGQVTQDRRPFHDEVVADRGDSGRRREPP